MHYDPYDLSQVFVRTPDGWITAPWTQLPMVSAPFADFTWHHARRLAAQAGLDDTDERQVARVLDRLLTRAEHGPDRRTAKVVGRTRAATPALVPEPEPTPAAVNAEPARKPKPTSNVVPFGVFDAHAEAERWL